MAMGSLREARAWVRKLLASGLFGHCPCCGQAVKTYERRVLGTMVAQLRQLDVNGVTEPSAFVYLSSGGMYAQLRYWELAKQDDEGAWFITEKGQRFLHDQERIPKYAYVFNRACKGLSKETVSVRDCVGRRFEYEKIMQRTVWR